MVKHVVVVGGGSAGFLAAITLKARAPDLSVTVIRSREIGIIGVGEGSTAFLPGHLHGYLSIDCAEFYRLAEPIWKLGIKFLWGKRPFFHYSFENQFEARRRGYAKNAPYYFPRDGELAHTGPGASLMTLGKAFHRITGGTPLITRSTAYHLENEKFVRFLEGYAARLGVGIVDDTIVEVRRDDHGVTGLRLASGANRSGDLYVDCSGFQSLLLSKTFGEPLVDFRSSLFCDRAVVGGWQRGDERILPYTTAETMDAGWCWQIEHEHRINRGYVYSSAFISDEDAERELRAKNPKIGPTRVVKFVSGRYERSWVKNVVAIGNASGFVEPLESTSLAFICTEAVWLIESLLDADREIRPAWVGLFNKRVGRAWDVIRQFLALHYKFNDRLDTPFWRECREKTDLGGAAEFVDYYRENGPSALWYKTLLNPDDQFQMEGYLAMLVGQRVPYHTGYVIPEHERRAWAFEVRRFEAAARAGYDVPEALAAVRDPRFQWPQDLYPRVCAPAPPAAT
jgi:tryptophan halogenase